MDAATAAVASFVPVGNDPQSLALSDDGSALWVGLVGERRVRRLTPGATPVPGPAYSLPMLLTTGEASVPSPSPCCPGRRRRSPSACQGTGRNYYYYGRRGVFILDDGQPRANFIQPPEVAMNFLTNGPPGYLLGVGDDNNLVVLRLGAVGATLESHGGLFNVYDPPELHYSRGRRLREHGRGRRPDQSGRAAARRALPLAARDCKLASRSATRVMMFCPNYDPAVRTCYMLRHHHLHPGRLGDAAPRAARRVGEVRLSRR